jgi:hypothetical protein
MERFLWIGKNTGIRVFMDRLDIISTYLPLFPPMKGEVLTEISDCKKANILYYDALPNYYIKKMKNAKTAPIEISLEDLFQFALNIEEAVINPGKDSGAILGIAKSRKPKPQLLRSRGVKVKIIRRVEEKTSILKDQEFPSCLFGGRKGHTEIACHTKQLQEKTPRTEVLSEKRIKLKNLKSLLQLLHLLRKKIVLVMKMRTTRTKRLL